MATTGKRRVQALERTAAVAALVDQGLPRQDVARVLKIKPQDVDKALDSAKLEMRARAAEYARLHMAACEVAAEKGRTEGMQWALERIGVVDPPKVMMPDTGNRAPIINIGIALPGLPVHEPPVLVASTVEE